MVGKQMDLQEVLTLAIGTLVTVVLAHLAVFWVIRTLYPPPPKIIQVPVPVQPQQTYTPPPVIEQQQHVELPTYTAPVPVEAPREERKGPPP
jgi:hypothetical protein